MIHVATTYGVDHWSTSEVVCPPPLEWITDRYTYQLFDHVVRRTHAMSLT